MSKLKIKYYFIILFIINIFAYASGSNKDSDILVNSDDLTVDKITNTATFRGEVIMWFEDITLKTTKIKIFYKKIAGKNKIDKIIIPNKLIASKEKNQDILIADAAEYFFDKNELTLNGNVILLHKDDILKTKKLVFISELKKIDNKK